MNTSLVQWFRLPSLVVAAALQILPLTRAAVPLAQSTGQLLAIVFRWAAGAATALGSIQAVSGASTTITSAKTTTGTNGVPFSFRVTTAPDQAGYWTASGLPLGLSLSGTSGKPLWRIQGTPTETGEFTVRLTAKEKSNSTGNRVISGTMVIKVLAGVAPPVITAQPGALEVIQGQDAVFRVTATGSGLTYQWRKDGQAIQGATAATLTLPAVTSAAAGRYDVVVTSSGGTLTSDAADLVVLVPPSVVTAPKEVTVAEGAPWELRVEAAGTAPLSYQWQFQGADLAGETSAVLARAAGSTNDTGAYQVVVRNSAGSVTTVPVSVTVTPKAALTAPVLSVVLTAPGLLSVSFDAVAGGVYTIERSFDLVAWEAVSVLGPSLSPGVQTVEVQTPEGVSAASVFVRVRASN